MPPFRHSTLAPLSGVNGLGASIGRTVAAEARPEQASTPRRVSATTGPMSRRRLLKAFCPFCRRGTFVQPWSDEPALHVIPRRREAVSSAIRLGHSAVVERLVE